MSYPLRCGIISLPTVSWPVQAERWQRLEAWGFDSLWLADHFANPIHPSQDWLEAWTLLAALATVTRTARIGTLVTPPDLRHPAMLARQALTVDNISGGRLDLGIGAGNENDVSYPMIGAAKWSKGERVARFRETIEVVDTLLRKRVSSYAGRYYQLQDAQMSPPPVQQPRPPLTIAALSPATLRIAAQYADTWNSYAGGTLSAGVALTRQRAALLDDACGQIGRDPASIRRSLLILRPAINPFASLDAFADLVGSYREAGIDELIFYYPASEFYPDASADVDAVFERVATDLLPGLRAQPS